MLNIQKTRNLKAKWLSKLSTKLQHCNTASLPAMLLSAALPFCLQGCMGVYDGGFECPPGEGVGCKSISEVNQMVNEGALPKKENDSHTKPCEQCNSPVDLQEKDSEESFIWYSPTIWEEA